MLFNSIEFAVFVPVTSSDIRIIKFITLGDEAFSLEQNLIENYLLIIIIHVKLFDFESVEEFTTD